MNKLKIKFIAIVIIGTALTALSACNGLSSMPAQPLPPAPPPAAPLPSEDKAVESSIRFLENKIKDNPNDFVAYNMLAGYYLQRLYTTGSVTYLELASKAVQASIDFAPKEMNFGGLSALAEIEYASHNFAASRDDAKELIKFNQVNLGTYQILGDSLMELGDYEKAAVAYKEMERRTDYSPQGTAIIGIRLSRQALLQGKTDAAEIYLKRALSSSLEAVPTSRATVAFCRWQLGDTAFSIGKYEEAEKHYRDALTTFPDYYRAVASLGRVRAAQGNLLEAIEEYEQAVKLVPDPSFVAALGDLYKLAGRDKESSAQYELVEQIGKLSKLNGTLYNRQLALFYADHDMKAEEAYALATKEYEVRKDIYGADAIAWTALKAGKIPEAQAAMKEALRLGTQDAKLFYHAAMIAKAAGDNPGAKDYLERVMKLNPQFDPLQSTIAKKALQE